MIRTCDTGFRRAVLYPLSYGGGNRRKLTWLPLRARNGKSELWQKCQNFVWRPVACLAWS